MRSKPITVEMLLSRIAHESHGVVTRRQLLDAGITVAELNHRLRIGALLRVHRGVYRVGHRAPSVEATYLAAVRACGDDAFLSGPAAGHTLGLLRGAPPAPEVTTRTVRQVPGVKTRRSPGLARGDVRVVDGIPVTSVERTLVDLAARLSKGDLARACHEAGVRYDTTPAHVETVLARRPSAPGARNLRDVLRGDVPISLSRLESTFLTLVRDSGLPTPHTNRRAKGRRVDCRWPAYRLTVELDSYRFHRSRHAWELDRRREREAHARGDEFRRYTYDDVVAHPRQMLRELRSLLRQRDG